MTRRMIIATIICAVLGAGVYWFQENVVMRDLKAQIDENELADFRAHFILQEGRLLNHQELMGRMLLLLEDAKAMNMDSCGLPADFLDSSSSLRITVDDMRAVHLASKDGGAFALKKGARNEMLSSAFWEYIPPRDSMQVPEKERKAWMQDVIAFGEMANQFQQDVKEMWILEPEELIGETGWRGRVYRFDMDKMEATCVQRVTVGPALSAPQTPAEL